MKNEKFKHVAQLKVDIAYNDKNELESFYRAMLDTNKNNEFKVKVVGELFDPQDVSIWYSNIIK